MFVYNKCHRRNYDLVAVTGDTKAKLKLTIVKSEKTIKK